ncbi:unnamed protein product [Rhizophagus irregularis]|nr:unnamed protein product [Rhizophagus irregularis]
MSFYLIINFSPVPVKFLHDSKWKEVLSKQKQVVDNILLVLKEVWNNHTYSDHKFTKKLNEVELIVTTHIYRELMYLETTRTYLLCVTKKER